MSITILILIAGLGTWFMAKALSKEETVIGDKVKMSKLSERDIAFNQFNNADSVEAVDMACYKLKADDMQHSMVRRSMGR